MKVLKLLFVVSAFVLLCGGQLYADPINVYMGGGTAQFTNTGSGQRIVFSGNVVSTGDAIGRPLTISPGSGSFLFTSVSGGHGYFAPLSGATFSMGDTTSGIARGSITSIEIIGSLTGGAQTSFTVQLTFNKITFQPCSSSATCVNSSVLQNFGSNSAYGTALLSVYLSNSKATNVSQLLGLAGTNTSTMSGEFDATEAPEPASLALFGTGLLVVGMKVRRRRKPDEIE